MSRRYWTRRVETSEPAPTSTTLADIVKARAVPDLADRINAHRFARDQHPNLPDTFYAGMRYAERLARGDETPCTIL